MTADEGIRMGTDIFICHSTKDKKAAKKLRAHLESAKYSCWMAPEDVRGPGDYAEQIPRAIDECKVMIVAFSRNAMASKHVAREVNIALKKLKPIIPVRLEAAEPEGSLEYLLDLEQWVDVFPGPMKKHLPAVYNRVEAMTGGGDDGGKRLPEVTLWKRLLASWRWTFGIMALLVAVGAIAAVVFLLTGGGDEQAGPKTARAGITSPVDGGEVGFEEVVRGTSQDIPEAEELWILVYPHEAARFYPQDRPIEVNPDGTWSTLVFTGGEKDKGMDFDLLVVLADEEAQAAITDYQEESSEASSWEGMEALPGGAVELDRVTVTRR